MSQQKAYSLNDLFLPSVTGESSQYSVRNALNNPDMLPAAEIGKRDQAAEVMGTTYGEADAGWDDVSTEMQIRKAESVPNADKWVAESSENASFLDTDADALMAVYDDLQAQGLLTDQDIDRSTMQDVASGGPSGLDDTLERGRLANERTDIGLAYREGRISADEARSQLSSIDDRLAVLSERRSDPLGFYGFVEQGYRMLTRDLPQAGYRALEGGLVGASAGAAAGATLGTAVPVVGNLVGAGGGALGGAFGGAAAGLARGMFESSRDMEEANFLADMLIQKDDAGQYLDEDSVRNAAMLYGNLSALVEVGGDALSVAVLKYVSPAVKTAMAKLGVQSPKLFVKDAVKTAISNKSAWPALRRFVVGMGLGAAAEGAEEAVQEGISGQIEATTKNWLADLGVNYFREEQKGLLSGDTWAQMAEAGIEGAKVGAWFVLLPGVTQLAVDSARVSRAREFASSVEKVTDTINATQTKQLSPARMESFLKAQGLNQTVFIPADAAWQMQREGVDIAAPLGWEQQTLEEAAALGHDIAVPLARLEARLDADAMKRVAQILKEGPDSPNAMQAQDPNLYLADDVEAINEAAAEWEFEQNILSHDIERLRSMLTEAVRSVPGLLKDLTSSADTETSVGSYVDSIIKLVENAEQRLAAYGGQTGSVISDFMNRLQIQGLVRDEKGRARTPEEMERAAVEEAQAQADAPFWENVWGRIDPDSLKRDFPDARNELAKLHGRGLFARKGEGLPVDELADILKNAGWLQQDADSSTLVEMLKEKKTPKVKPSSGRTGVTLYQHGDEGVTVKDSKEGGKIELADGSFVEWSRQLGEDVEVVDEYGDVDYEPGPDYMLIEGVYVAPDSRQKGIGRKLLRSALARIKSQDSQIDVRLSADPIADEAVSQEDLVSFYESEGFDVSEAEGMSGIPMEWDKRLRKRGDEENLYQFLGAQGISRMDLADEVTIRMDNLAVARSMDRAGKDARVIKEATGWERGADGKWRYEVGDVILSKAWFERNLKTDDSGSGSFSGSLADVVPAELLSAYPALQDVPVTIRISPSSGRAGAYSSDGIEISAPSSRDVNSLLNHEIQHAIQEQEGFARGGSPEEMRDMAIAQVQERLSNLERGDDIRMLMEMEDDTFFDEVPAELRPLFEAKLEELRQTITPEDVAQYRELAAGMDYESVSESAFNLYRQLMGEVEARNVQTRMGMTMEERLSSLASETEDVAREDQIFLEHAARSAMMAQDEAGMAAGRITTLESGEYAIQLFRGANLSTVAHEISHAVHMEMERIEADGRATPALQRDLDALRRWTSRMDDDANLKAEYDKYQKGLYGGMAFEDLDELALLVVRRTAKQEMIARGFEAYLREGVAPSAQMEGVFRRFKKWLMRVYRQAVMLDVELTDEVREVFDRLVASDEDIEAAAAARSVRDESAGILDALGVKGADRLTMEGLIADAKDKAADALRRDRARNRRDNVKQWRDEVERELDNDHVYQARKAMRRTPIDLDAVVETYGQEMADKLRAKLPAAMKRGGDNPELLAFDYGFQNAGEMIQAILNKPGLAERRSELMAQKRADADARFAAEDYLFEQEELANQQDKIGEIVYRLEMSGRTQGGQLVQGDTFIERWRVAREQLKTVAEQYLDKQTAAEAVRPDLYRTAAARFMREERYAILSKDWAAALQANYRARLNIEIAKQAADRRDMVEKLTARAKRFIDSPLPDKGARFAVFVLSQQTRLFNPTRKMIQNAADKGLDDIRSFLDDMKEQGYYTVDAEIPESLFTSSPAAWRSMPWNELRPYLEAMAVTMHMEQKARKANSEAARESWRNEMDGIANSILSLNPHRENGPLEKQNVILKKLKEVHASHLKADTICRLLDGDAEFGPAWSAIIQPINRATADRDRRLRAAQKQVRKLFAVYSAREWVDIRGNRIFIQALGKSITKEQMLAMALNSGNASNKQRLMDGMGLTETQVQAVIDMLDERDVKFVQAVWDYLETFRKESFDLEESLTGVRPQAIEATPVQTRFGELRGGYYPVVYDSEASSKPIDADSIGTLTGSMMPAVDHGSMKQRTANGLGTALQLDLEAVPRHVVKTIHMLAFRKPVQQVARVLNDKAVNSAIESTAGVAQSKALKSWLHYVAGERPGRNGWSRVLGQLRKNAALYTMGLKLTTILAQLTGLLSSVAEIGPRWVLSGLVNTYAFRNPFQVYRETAALSEVMANRMRSVDRDLYEMSTGVMERGSSNRILDPFVRFKNWQERNAFLPMGFVQMAFADLPTWQGAYHKALHDGMSQERAIQYADSVVERTQVGGADKDLAGVQRGEELGKIMTQFYSYFSALYQLYARRITMAKRRHSAADIGRLATLFLLTGVLEPVLSALVTRDSPDDDDDMEEWLAWAGRKIFFNPWNMVIGLRDITGAVESRMEGYSGKARVGSLLNDVIDSGIRFTTQLEKGMDMDAHKVFDSGWKLAGLATGQVNAQELLIIDELWDWLDGSNPDFELADLIRKKN